VSAFLERHGAWAILLSRSVPMLTEIVSGLAGLSRMRFPLFLALSAAGTLPICAVYAWAGARADALADWRVAVAVAFLIPAAGFGVIRLRHRRG
jgi:membrane protein DedA with SNARE-associated domain